MTSREVNALRARVELLESVLGEAYQLAGAIGAPLRVLDNLAAAVDGRSVPHETFLPVRAEECDEVAELLHLLGNPAPRAGTEARPKAAPAARNALAAVLGRAGGRQRTRAKTAAARANGAKGGRPRNKPTRAR